MDGSRVSVLTNARRDLRAGGTLFNPAVLLRRGLLFNAQSTAAPARARVAMLRSTRAALTFIGSGSKYE